MFSIVQGCKQCQHRSSPRKQDDPDIIPDRSGSKGSGYRSRNNCLSMSSSSSAGDENEEHLREPWKGSSGLDQGALSTLSRSSGENSDEKYPEKSQSSKVHCKHVRISDVSSDGSSKGRLHTPTQRVSSPPKLQRTRFSSSDEGSKVSSHRLKYRSRVDSRGKNGSSEIVKELSSSDDGQASRSKIVSRNRNASDSSNDGSEDSGTSPEKSRLPQVRRPPSRMQRPRQLARPRATSQKKPDGQGGVEGKGIPAVSRSQRSKDGGQHHDPSKASQEQVDQTDLGWQQLQLQQQQDRRHKQQVAAHRQQQENQQRLFNQQQQWQKEQQEQAAANLQRQQEILVQQQQQQLKRHQMQQLQQQKSLESVAPKPTHPQAAIMKRSSQQDLASAQKKRAEMVAVQDMRHSSPDLIDNKVSESLHTATVHHTDRHTGLETQKSSSKSRLHAPSAVSRLPTSRQTTNAAAKRENNSPSHTSNITNGIPVPKSKMPSPMPAKRGIPTTHGSSTQRQSPPAERRIPGPAGNQRLTGTQIHTNQNNNPQLPQQHQSTTFTTTTTTITTTTQPQASSSTHPSKLPSPSKSNQKPVSRLAQPKVKVQSRIPKSSGIPTRGRDAN